MHVPNFGGLSGLENRSGSDNSIKFINFGRVGDKSFKEWRQKLGGWKGGCQEDFDFFVPLYLTKNATFLFILTCVCIFIKLRKLHFGQFFLFVLVKFVIHRTSLLV